MREAGGTPEGAGTAGEEPFTPSTTQISARLGKAARPLRVGAALRGGTRTSLACPGYRNDRTPGGLAGALREPPTALTLLLVAAGPLAPAPARRQAPLLENEAANRALLRHLAPPTTAVGG